MAFNTFPTSSPWPPLELANDLNDNFSKTVEVSLSTNPVDGAVLVYDASADIWTDGQETVTLDDLTNVVLDTAPADGDILTYDASSDTWINSPAVTYSLGELDDVVLPTTPADGDALIYDASSDTWITGSGGVTTLEALTDVVLSTNPTDGSALVYDASSDTWVDGEAAGGDPTINSQTGTSYTLVIGDAYNTVSMDNASANTLTIPTNASVAFDTGTVIAVLQEGAGTTTVSGDTGVTVNGTSGGSEDIGTQYASAALVKVGTDEWVVAVGSGSSGGGGTTINGRRNILINGAMQVAQRGNQTGINSAGNTFALDRWKLSHAAAAGTIDMTRQSDGPSGFANCLEVEVTTAGSISSGDFLLLRQILEGQDCQHLKKGTSDALQTTLSFWVKSNVTGTYQVNLRDLDNTRMVSATYTVSASATWEQVEITFPADTSGVLDDNNGGSFEVEFWLSAGSNFTSGAAPSAWEATTTGDRAAGHAVNLSDTNSNYWRITGVQLETGDTATEFEYQTYQEQYLACARYYWQPDTASQALGSGIGISSTSVEYYISLPVKPRSISAGDITVSGGTGCLRVRPGDVLCSLNLSIFWAADQGFFGSCTPDSGSPFSSGNAYLIGSGTASGANRFSMDVEL